MIRVQGTGADSEGSGEADDVNRRRIQGARGKRLLRQRSELLERPNAHLYKTGGMRRVHLRGHPNSLKRLLVHVCGFNLGLLMRQLTGVGTPRSLQGRLRFWTRIGLLCRCGGRVPPSWTPCAMIDRFRRGEDPAHITMNTRSATDPWPLLPRADSYFVALGGCYEENAGPVEL